MDEYIRRDAVLSAIFEMQSALCPAGRFGRSFINGSDRETFDTLQEVSDKIKSDIPAADVALVVRGIWTEIRNYHGELEGWIHEECGREVKCAESYCPNCGALMFKEE